MYTDILILSRLATGPAHGYEIKKHVERIVGPKTINNNVLYPALRRFEADGAIERVAVESPAGRPPRSVFRLTDTGADLLRAYLHDTDPDILASEPEFQTRVGFFDQLEPADRLAVLAVRRAVIDRQIQVNQQLRPAAQDHHPWGLRILDFNLLRLRAELDWLDQLAAEAGTADDPRPA